MELQVESRKIDSFELRTEQNRVIIKGDMYISQEAIRELSGFFGELHKAILEAGLETVIVDMKDLAFLNSSGLREMLQWINTISTLAPEKQYNIQFNLDTNKSWQAVMLQNLRNFSQSIVSEYTQDNNSSQA